MRINIAWESKNKMGGGWSFTDAFINGLKDRGHQLSNWQEADVVLIPSASVITKELFRAMKEANKKMILRIDNAIKNSRNSGTGMSRLKEFATGVNEVVFQGKWCREYLSPFIERQGVIIHNGIDLNVFNDNQDSLRTDYWDIDGLVPRDYIYLYSCASKGETKRWEWAWYEYQMIQRKNPRAQLLITGNFPDEVRNNNFDFFMNEKFRYLGMITDRQEMALIYRSAGQLLATYENDAFSQTYMEALCCGCELHNPSMTGGTPELINLFNSGREYFSDHRMVNDYLQLFESML